jgi:hypothetical protein
MELSLIEVISMVFLAPVFPLTGKLTVPSKNIFPASPDRAAEFP